MKIKSESKKREGKTTLIVEMPEDLASSLKIVAIAAGRHLRAEAEVAFAYWVGLKEEQRQKLRARLARDTAAKLRSSSVAKKDSGSTGDTED